VECGDYVMDKLDEHEEALTDEKIDSTDRWYIGICLVGLVIVWYLFFKWWLS